MRVLRVEGALGYTGVDRSLVHTGVYGSISLGVNRSVEPARLDAASDAAVDAAVDGAVELGLGDHGTRRGRGRLTAESGGARRGRLAASRGCGGRLTAVSGGVVVHWVVHIVVVHIMVVHIVVVHIVVVVMVVVMVVMVVHWVVVYIVVHVVMKIVVEMRDTLFEIGKLAIHSAVSAVRGCLRLRVHAVQSLVFLVQVVVFHVQHLVQSGQTTGLEFLLGKVVLPHFQEPLN